MTNPTPNLDWNLFAMWRGFLATLFVACALMQGGCAYNGTATINLSLINSRSPAINGVGENLAEAANGYEGGGKLDADIKPAGL